MKFEVHLVFNGFLHKVSKLDHTNVGAGENNKSAAIDKSNCVGTEAILVALTFSTHTAGKKKQFRYVREN